VNSPEKRGAPIVIFVYNRAKHTRRLLESLLQCHYESQPLVYVFCDGPRNEGERSQVEQVRNVLAEFSSRLPMKITISPTNKGLAESVISGVSLVLQMHKTAIVLEDDLVVAPDFLKFMNWGLETFETNQRVFSVSGFTFPSQYFPLPAHYPHNVLLSPRCSSWSWATWSNRWQDVDWSMSYYPMFRDNPNRVEQFNAGGSDLSKLLELQTKKKIDSWAIRFCFAHYENTAYCLHPRSTLVHNRGLDGSGTHSRPERRFEHKDSFGSWTPNEEDSAVEVSPLICEQVRRFYDGRTGPLMGRIRGLVIRSRLLHVARRILYRSASQ